MISLLVPAVSVGYTLTWWTVDGGGQTQATGGGFVLSGTVGQPDASATAALTGGGFSLTGGFWGVTLPTCNSYVAPDFDQDCDVDQDDWQVFEACATGAGVGGPPSGCAAEYFDIVDFDNDNDVDQRDFGVFERCVSGQNNPADPGCAE